MLTTSEATYQTVTVLPPADGVVVVSSQAHFRRDDLNPDPIAVRCGISSTSVIDTAFLQIVTLPVSGMEDFENMSATRAFEVTEGNLLTVNLVCIALTGTAFIGQPALSAIFAPD